MIIEFDALLQFSFQEMDAKYLVVLLAGIFFTCQAQYSNPTAVKDVAKTTGSVSKAPKMEMFKCSETQLKDSDAGQKSALCHGRWPEDQSLTPEVSGGRPAKINLPRPYFYKRILGSLGRPTN